MRNLNFLKKRKFLPAFTAAVIILASCDFLKLNNDDEVVSGNVGDVTYYAARNLDKLMELMNSGQSEERYGDIGTVIEWDVDWNYLVAETPKADGSGKYPPYLTAGNVQDYIDINAAEKFLWYKVELWGADGGNVNTKQGAGDPPDSVYNTNGDKTPDGADLVNFEDEWYKAKWGEDHFGKTTPEDLDFGWGGKGGYIGAYLKVYQGQIFYFFIGGKGKDGTVVPASGIGEEVIYGFNGGGKGSPGRSSSYLDGGGGGGATSLALNMADFFQAVNTETGEPLVDGKGNPIYQYNFLQGYLPGAQAVSDGAHYSSRLLVAGGGGGAGQGHGNIWYSLHGGNGNGGAGEAQNMTSSAGSKYPSLVKQVDLTNPETVWGTNAQFSLLDANSQTVVKQVDSFSFNGFSNYSYKASGNWTRGLIIPGSGNGKGMDGGYSTLSGYFEGRGGGGGGWIGGGAFFNPAATGNDAIPPSKADGVPRNGYFTDNNYPTAAGMGGSNGAVSGIVTINGQTPSVSLSAGMDAVVMAPVYDLANLNRDPQTFRIKSAPAAYKPVEIKLVKGSTLTGPGSGSVKNAGASTFTYTKTNMGADGLGGFKEADDINDESKRTTFQGNGFIDIHLVKLSEIQSLLANNP